MATVYLLVVVITDAYMLFIRNSSAQTVGKICIPQSFPVLQCI